MLCKKALLLIILCCLFENASHCMTITKIEQNAHSKEFEKKVGKKLFSFGHAINGAVVDRWYYTTELSRILIVGEPRMFESVRGWPIISGVYLFGPLFDNRFDDFIENAKQFSQQKLEEAVQDAILLSPYSSKGYSVNKLLDYLIEALQHKVADIKEQVEHNYKWHQKSYSNLKKSVAVLVGLIATVAITSKNITHNDKNKKNKVSNLEFLSIIATFGCIPASYKVLKGCYKVVTIDPNASNQYLKKYEELLIFLQKIKLQLETSGCITFKLESGYTATIKDNQVIFNVGLE